MMTKILIVDDRASNRLLLFKLLSNMGGFELIEANNGKEAILQFEKELPDLILMDINMPELDGYQSATAIKAIVVKKYCPIIFVTALNSVDSLQQALSAGGDDFIGKPVNAAILESKIKAHLRICDLHMQLQEKNEQLHIVNQQLSQEQELIEHFFENSLSQSFLDPSIIKYHMSSLSVFAGDIFLVERGPEGGLFVIMGDFTGHGLSAAMGTLPVAMLFSKMVANSATVEEIATEINYQLNKLLPSGMFCAATILNIDPAAEKMNIWMGGLPESYWFSKNNDLRGIIHSQHMALGILSSTKFSNTTQSFDIQIDDKIYLYSDGITEACNLKGEMLGDERFKELLEEHKTERFNNVLNEFKTFIGNSDQLDDITFVEVTVTDIPKPVNFI